MTETTPKTACKVVLLGDTGVGKSSIALRFTSNEFHPYSESTIGASFMSKELEFDSAAIRPSTNDESSDDLIENQLNKKMPTRKEMNTATTSVVQFNIWDTAGQEKYHSLAAMYYRGAECAILCFDICKQVSFDALQKWVDELRDKGPPDISLAVCGNKVDLVEDRQVDEFEARSFATRIGGFYMEVSARDNINITELFEEIARRAPTKDDDQQNTNTVSLAESRHKNFWSSWC